MERRSKRTRRQPRKSYTDDLKDIAELDLSSSESEIEKISHPKAQETNHDDEEYGQEEADSVAEDEESLDETASAENSFPGVDPSDSELASSAEEGKPGKKRRRRDSTGVPALRSVGIPRYRPNSTSKDARVTSLVGGEDEDLIAYVQTRDAWMNALPLPSKNDTKKYGKTMMQSPYYTSIKLEKDLKDVKTWFFENGGDTAFRKLQVSTALNENEGIDMLARDASQNEIFLRNQSEPSRLVEISPFKSFSLAKAEVSDNSHRTKPGWIIKTDPNVRCLEWAPQQTGTSQYLIISSRDSLGENSSTTAFEPNPPSRSYFHLWEIRASDKGQFHELNGETAPKLRAVFSFDWNEVKQLKWCPISPFTDLEKSGHLNSEMNRIGLLAGVFLDGFMRVLDISIPRSENTQYIHISKAAFQAKPLDAMCTSVAWHSGISIATGCSNGCVAIWNIADSMKQNLKAPGDHSSPNARPWFYKPILQTYIYNVQTGFPSRPHFLFCNSVDGVISFTDLRDTRADSTVTIRNRGNQTSIAWLDCAQGLICVDDNYTIKACYTRMFNGQEGLSRMESSITEVATSLNHPHVLAACADGSVGCANVVRRTFSSRKVPGLHSKVTWFRYEHRDALPGLTTVSSEANGNVSNLRPEQVRSRPMGRFLEGFKMKAVSLASDNSASSNKEGRMFSIIYGLSNGITRVSWNPNLNCGAWAAAATATGLVRIEDLGID